MTKLLWISDSPALPTGFGTVGRYLLRALHSTGKYRICCLGRTYEDHFPEANTPDCPYDIIAFGSNLTKQTRDAIRRFQPEVLITLGDLWDYEWMTTLPERGLCRWIAYTVIDAGPLPKAFIPVVLAPDKTVTCSEFGAKVLTESVRGLDVEIIPHGVDAKVFHPLKGKRPLKVKAGLRDRFVVGCVGRNQPRKQIPLLIKAFADFHRDCPEGFLYLHTDPEDPMGWDLHELIKRHGLTRHCAITEKVTLLQGVPPDKLNEIYNLFDVFVLPSNGEGFGLPILEAMAAGVPVMATDYSACTELVAGRGELISVADTLTSCQHSFELAVPDRKDLTAKLHRLHGMPDLRQRYATLGREFAESMGWGRVAGDFDELISDCLSGRKHISRRTSGSARVRTAREKIARENEVAVLVSGYERCGVTQYARYLTEPLGSLARLARYEGDLFEAIGRSKALHVQFHQGIVDPEDLKPQLLEAKEEGVLLLATIHDLARAEEIVDCFDAVIVHTPSDFRALQRITENAGPRLYEIRQGFPPWREPPRREKGTSDWPRIGYYGFMAPHKGVEQLISAAPKLKKRYPEFRLLLLSSVHEQSRQSSYHQALLCQEMVRELEVENCVELVTDYLEMEEVFRRLQSCDLIVLPYGETPRSGSSAAVRTCIASGRPVLVSDTGILGDLGEEVMKFPLHRREDLASVIEECLSDSQRLLETTHNARQVVDTFNWEQTAARHRSLYLKLLRDPRAFDPFAVIVPTANKVFSEHCILSVANAQGISLIVVNSGAPMSEPIRKHPCITVVDEPFQSVAHAWNVGAACALAQGAEGLCLLNDDVFVLPHTFINMKELLLEYSCVSMFQHVDTTQQGVEEIIGDIGAVKGEIAAGRMTYEDGLERAYQRSGGLMAFARWVEDNLAPLEGALTGSGFAFSRLTWLKIRSFDERFRPLDWEDVDTAARLHWVGETIVSHPSLYLHHWAGMSSIDVRSKERSKGQKRFHEKWKGTYFEGWGHDDGQGLPRQQRYGVLNEKGKPVVDEEPPQTLQIGVAIVVYNGMDYLPFALRSIYDSASSIVVVEGSWKGSTYPERSTDGTVEFLEEFPDPEGKILLLSANEDEVAHRNLALERLRQCDWYFIVDADEVYSPEVLARIREVLESDPHEILWHDIENFVFYYDFTMGVPEGGSRLFRITPGCYFGSQNMMHLANGDTYMNHPHETLWSDFSHLDATENAEYLEARKDVKRHGILMYHYGYVPEKKVKERLDLYQYPGMDRWFEQIYTRYDGANEERLYEANQGGILHPGMKLARFVGEHPRIMEEHPLFDFRHKRYKREEAAQKHWETLKAEGAEFLGHEIEDCGDYDANWKECFLTHYRPELNEDELAELYVAEGKFASEQIAAMLNYSASRIWLKPLMLGSANGKPKVLDFGCGVGEMSLWFADTHDCRSEVTLVDIPGRVLDFARWRFERRELPVTILSHKDPLPQEAYDVVLCLDVMEHLLKPVEKLKELHKALKQGGLLWFHAPFGEDGYGGHIQEAKADWIDNGGHAFLNTNFEVVRKMDPSLDPALGLSIEVFRKR